MLRETPKYLTGLTTDQTFAVPVSWILVGGGLAKLGGIIEET
jgi:hypothetical protein